MGAEHVVNLDLQGEYNGDDFTLGTKALIKREYKILKLKMFDMEIASNIYIQAIKTRMTLNKGNMKIFK